MHALGGSFCNIGLTVIYILHDTMPIWVYGSLETL